MRSQHWTLLVVFDPTTSAPGSARQKRTAASAPWRALYLDSLGGSKPGASGLLGSFLKCVSDDKEQPGAGADSLMSAVRVQAPQQPNHYDCGFYMVMCARPPFASTHLAAASMRAPAQLCQPLWGTQLSDGARCASWCPGLSTS